MSKDYRGMFGWVDLGASSLDVVVGLGREVVKLWWPTLNFETAKRVCTSPRKRTSANALNGKASKWGNSTLKLLRTPPTHSNINVNSHEKSIPPICSSVTTVESATLMM
ncbi:hypothetical protein J1614_011019 [Plenodomus biglobosus]|nr:hypothetical protein J1614_011019 [Plenodomus biglobosus]